jgi:Beta-lactamase class C and other penicillin binding proteins
MKAIIKSKLIASITLPILLTFIIMNTSSCSSKIDDPVAEKIDNYFSSLLKFENPGAAVLIMKGDSIIFAKGYGVTDLNTMTPIDENTFFNIASISKQFSAVALMMLSAEGKLSLDDTVAKWFPEFKSPLMEQITLRHLLSHTSGIPDNRDREDRHFATTATDTNSYAYISNLEKLNFIPGTAYEYMNPTYQLMYTIIERASGIKFDDFMEQKIFKPSGMTESTYFEPDKQIPHTTRAYNFDKESKKYVEYDYGEETFFATKADGGLFTSVNEFVKWEIALRNNSLISEEMRKEAHSPKIETNGSSYSDYQNRPHTYYGYGWFIEESDGMPQKVYHTGSNGGYRAYAGRFPEQKILYLFFSNKSDVDVNKVASHLDTIFKEAGWLQ